MSSSSDCGLKIDPVAVIQDILDGYPLGVGIFREILQNSEDAKASKQIFLLDARQHAVDSLYHPQLKNTQGPALIAYNDAAFEEADWEALQTVHQSSKKTDTSKIGKYGIGSRSCYHITDNPQVLSSSFFAMFDLQNQFTRGGGVRINVSEVSVNHLDSLNLEWFSSLSGDPESFPGTIIRLPLRAEKSKIKKEPVTHADISRLVEKFVQEELDIVLLFLSSLRSIEIYEINEGDRAPRLIASTVVSTDEAPSTERFQTSVRRISTTLHGDHTQDKSWRVLHASFDESECADLLSKRLDSDAKETMKEEKLVPKIALGVPSSPWVDPNSRLGRLFTYLPLPLFTEFPCHIHGLFALDKSRQYLRNSSEKLLDKTPDRARVEWNMFLFDTLIPRAWAELVFTLIGQDKPSVGNLFRVWPHRRSDTSEWHCVPVKLLEEIISTNKVVWPIFPYSAESGASKYSALDEVLVASEADVSTEDFPGQLLALATAGLRITQLPQHVYNLTKEHAKVRLLTPNSAQEALKECMISPALTEKNRNLILSYLLSSGELETIIGLPLIPLVDGSVASLCKHLPVRVLLDADAQSLFESLDPLAISLSQLPSLAVRLLLESDGRVNVKVLSCEQVIDYLNLVFQKFHTSSTPIHDLPLSPEAIEWFGKFWAWVSSWSSRNQLYPSLKSHPSLPTTKNGLQSPFDGIFLRDTQDPQLFQLLESIGAPFLHQCCSANHAVHKYLEDQCSIKSTSRMQDLLDHIRPTSLSGGEIERLREHIIAPNTSFEGVDRAKLRYLPIFSRLVPHGCAVTHSLESIAEELELKCVLEDSILPILPRVFYTSDLRLARVVDPHIQQLSEVEVIRLAIEHFPTQPPELQVAFLTRMHVIREELPQKMLQDLRVCVFVPDDSGDLHSPAEIYDPESEVAKLLLEGDFRLPRRSTQMDKHIVDALRMLELLNGEFTLDFARERLEFVAADARGITLSEKLLDEMDRRPIEYIRLSDIINRSWLPTNRGLCSPSGCRDKIDEVLCKDVLPLLTRGTEVRSPKLREAFGWNMPIPLSVVVEQFRHILTDTKAPRSTSQFYNLILEFGSRVDEFDDDAIRQLTSSINDQEWIPIRLGSSQKLSTTAFAVFGLDDDLPIFGKIRRRWEENPGIKNFLERMGCTHSPSNQALLQAITLCKDSVRQVVALLKALHFEELSEDKRAFKFVPDSDGTLRAPSELCYNDLGTNPSQSSSPGEILFAHKDIGYELAIQLKLTLLSSSKIPLDDDDGDMQVDLVGRISGILHQYTSDQAFLEFLANAADAKATKFGVCLDEFLEGGKQHLLTPAMAQFQQLPSLIIYNDGVFSDKDWKGIRRIGEGGKRLQGEEYGVDSSDATIGRFGVGALSMFHFTEVAMIVSGDQVLFLDPTRQYIDGTKTRSGQKIPLVTMKKHFPGHLASLEGIFGFSTNENYYHGTIFKLSLRTEQQARRENNPISNDWRSPDGIRDLLRDFYKRFAPSALLFIKIQEIRTIRRSPRGHQSDIWTVAVSQREPSVSRNATSQLEVVSIRRYEGTRTPGIEEKWQILVEHIPHDSIRKDHHAAMRNSHIRGVTIGIAGLLTAERPDCDPYRIFFGVPVPAYTSLPVHLHGSFILSEDRTNIRLKDDGDGNICTQSLYNRWLLSEKVPLVYLTFLETWPMARKLHESNWWPKSSPNDVISRVITTAFNRYFPSSERCICESFERRRIAPSKCVFDSHLPPGAKNILQLIFPPDLAKVPPFIDLSDALNQADDCYLARILQGAPDRFRSLFSSERIHILDVVEVVRFLGKSKEQNLLIGLPLIPLANGSLELFAKSGDAPTIYTWNSHKEPFPWSLFGSEHFLHQKVDAKLMIDQGLNVSELTGGAVTEFIESRFPPAGQRDMGDIDQKWIEDLWLVLQHLEVERGDISQFPLVPTYSSQPGDKSTITYLSIDQCDSDNTIPFGIDLPLTHLQSMQKLGASFVKRTDCPFKLRSLLSNFGYSFDAVLKFFGSIPEDQMPTCFSRMEVPGESGAFAAWIRDNLLRFTRDPAHFPQYLMLDPDHNSPRLKRIAGRLPVWEVIQAKGGRFVPAIAAARQIWMLPLGVELSTAEPFLPRSSQRTYAACSETLSKLEVESTLDMAKFRDLLAFPRLMNPISDAYMALIEVLVLYGEEGHPIQVPNANGRMESSKELYSRSQPLFRDAFSTRRERQKLLHPSLEHLETQLFKFGLRYHLTFESFLAAATAIHRDTEDQVRRATQVYHVYNHQLYSHILANTSLWDQLNALRFIPRDRVRRRTTLGTIPFDEFALTLPEVVSPAELLAPKYESVAWTQRALFRDEPSEVLSLSNPSLGQPSTAEVVEHLRVLSQEIASQYTRDPALISDLKATYCWLNERAHDARNELLDISQDELFLNVDDPNKDEWKWEQAQNLVFNVPDEANRRCIRRFLASFKDLLLSAGAHEIKGVTVPTNVQITPVEQTFATLRTNLDEMRRDEQLTDVILKTQGREFRAHRVILAGQSEYFRDMFTGSFRESSSAPVTIEYPDYTAKSVESTIDYLYTGNVREDFDCDSLVDIFKLSEYFRLWDLNTEVQMKLLNFISPGGCRGLLILSQNFPDGPLAEACKDYEAKNYATFEAMGLQTPDSPAD